MTCDHNTNITRYTNGFQCEDCDAFFGVDTPTYRSGEYLSSIWMVLHNINASSKERCADVSTMMDKIGIGIKHTNYEELIEEAEVIMTKYGKNGTSASVVIGE